MKITLSKGGTKERTLELSSLVLPDCWHIAQSLPTEQCERILATWHLAADLKRELTELDAERNAERAELLNVLNMAAKLVKIARVHFPKSIQNSDRFCLEITAAALGRFTQPEQPEALEPSDATTFAGAAAIVYASQPKQVQRIARAEHDRAKLAMLTGS